MKTYVNPKHEIANKILKNNTTFEQYDAIVDEDLPKLSKDKKEEMDKKLGLTVESILN